MRQIPYTMIKFAAFERILEALYKYVVPVPRDSLNKPQQLVVTFTAGYMAGVLCTLSHPADSVVSKLNSEKGSTAWEVAKKLGWKGEGCCIIQQTDGMCSVASCCISWLFMCGIHVAGNIQPHIPHCEQKVLSGMVYVHLALHVVRRMRENRASCYFANVTFSGCPPSPLLRL